MGLRSHPLGTHGSSRGRLAWMRLRTEDRGIARPHEGTFPSAAATWVTLLAADRAACRPGHRQVLAADVADAFLAPASSSKPWGLQPPREGATRAPSGLSHSRFTYVSQAIPRRWFAGRASPPPFPLCASVSLMRVGFSHAGPQVGPRPRYGCRPRAATASARTGFCVKPQPCWHCGWGGQPGWWPGRVSGAQLCLLDAQKRPQLSRSQLFLATLPRSGPWAGGPPHAVGLLTHRAGRTLWVPFLHGPSPLGHTCPIRQARGFKIKASCHIRHKSLASFHGGTPQVGPSRDFLEAS